MPRSSLLTLSERSVLGMFYIQRYRFLTISQFAREMRCTPEYLQSMRKRESKVQGKSISEFACYIRNFTPAPVRLAVPLGEMNRRTRLTDDQFNALLECNRARYSAEGGGVRVKGAGVGEASLEEAHGIAKPDLL